MTVRYRWPITVRNSRSDQSQYSTGDQSLSGTISVRWPIKVQYRWTITVQYRWIITVWNIRSDQSQSVQVINHCMEQYQSGDRFPLVDWSKQISFRLTLKVTAPCVGLLLAPAEALAFGRGFFCPLGKKEPIFLFRPIFGNLWSSSNLGNF